jgi:hypothetical protein
VPLEILVDQFGLDLELEAVTLHGSLAGVLCIEEVDVE